MNTPRLLQSDTYSLTGFVNESVESTDWSVYYGTFRKAPPINPKGDDRIVFTGSQEIIKELFTEPLTHKEIDDTIKFLKNRRATAFGLSDFKIDEKKWRDIVDVYQGKFPLRIEAVPEGSIVYPGEPVIRCSNTVRGFGAFAAHFEQALIKIWGTSLRQTNCRHWLQYNRQLCREVEGPDVPTERINFLASLMLVDFGARSAFCSMENEIIAAQHLYCFPGTDTLEAAWKMYLCGAPEGVGSSVVALAHRNVQAHSTEEACYLQTYLNSPHDSILSLVGDCYDLRNAYTKYLLPLGLRSLKEENNKIVVVRLDSGLILEDLLWCIDLAVKNDLVKYNSLGFSESTFIKFLPSDDNSWDSMREINQALIDAGHNPFSWILYGWGSGLRNLSRDDLSAKYALCSVGEGRPVIKFSNSPGKQTLPLVKVLRSKEALASGKTLVLPDEPGEDAMVTLYNGQHGVLTSNFQDFNAIQNRILNDFDKMPLRAGLPSDKVKELVANLKAEYVTR